MLESSFVFEPRLSIEVPNLKKDWNQFNERELSEISDYWEKVRETIFVRIRDFEKSIREKQNELDYCDEFYLSCQLVQEISEIASRLLELNRWFYWNETEDIILTSFQES